MHAIVQCNVSTTWLSQKTYFMTLLELLVVAADGLDKQALTVLTQRLSNLSPQLTHSMEKEFVKLLTAGLGMLVFEREVEEVSSKVAAKAGSASSTSEH